MFAFLIDFVFMQCEHIEYTNHECRKISFIIEINSDKFRT